MTTDATRILYRMSSVGHRFEARGFHLAEQILTPEAIAREARDKAFREDLIPVRDLMRPHAFASREARDAACRRPMHGGVFAMRPTTADELGAYLGNECLVAVGPRVAEAGFDVVASAIADPEIDSLFERCSAEELDPDEGDATSRTVVLTVFGAHYRIVIDGEWNMEVRAKDPFEALPKREL